MLLVHRWLLLSLLLPLPDVILDGSLRIRDVLAHFASRAWYDCLVDTLGISAHGVVPHRVPLLVRPFLRTGCICVIDELIMAALPTMVCSYCLEGDLHFSACYPSHLLGCRCCYHCHHPHSIGDLHRHDSSSCCYLCHCCCPFAGTAPRLSGLVGLDGRQAPCISLVVPSASLMVLDAAAAALVAIVPACLWTAAGWRSFTVEFIACLCRAPDSSC